MKDAGWNPVSPTEWRRAVGVNVYETWQFPDIAADRVSGDFDIAEFVSDLADDIRSQQWRHAAEHLHGEDLANGAGLTVARCQLKRFLKNDEFDSVGKLITMVSGGQWPHQRQLAEGYLVSLKCPRCGEADESLFHRVWECSRNPGHPAYEKTLI